MTEILLIMKMKFYPLAEANLSITFAAGSDMSILSQIFIIISTKNVWFISEHLMEIFC